MYTKWILVGVLATVFATHHLMPAHAQGHPAQGMPPMEQDLQKISALINLSPQQQSQIRTVHHEYLKALLDLKSQKGLTEVQLKQRFGQVREQALGSLKKILTASQIEALKQHGGLGLLLGEGKKGNSPFDLLAKLDLTPEQAGQIKRIIANAQQAMEQLKAEGNLAPDQLKMRMEEIHQQAFQEIHAVLTPAQLKRLQEMHQDQGGKVVPPGH